MMDLPIKTVWAYVCVNGNQDAHLPSIRLKRKDSIEAFVNEGGEPHYDWEYWKRNGWQCRGRFINFETSL